MQLALGNSVLLAALLVLPGAASTQAEDRRETPALAELLARPVAVEHTTTATHVPLEQRHGGLVVRAQANGIERDFVFDTGSPSIIARDFADQLGLVTIGSNTGRDANGVAVTMEFALLEELRLGEVVFNQVPVLIFDFATLELGRCIFDGGVIGSEILPGSAWRIDTGAQRLSIFAPGSAPAVAGTAISARLHPGGYPYPPIADYAISGLDDRLLFDTGSAEMVTLYEKAADDPRVRRMIAPGSRLRGSGTHGVSAGGMGASGPLQRFTLSDFDLGNHRLGPVRATTRVAPPSLIGRGLLATHVVTLDYPGERLVLEPRDTPAPLPPEIGYLLAIADGAVRVLQLYEATPAARAGLELGDEVVAVGEHRLPAIDPETICTTMRWLAEHAAPQRLSELTVRRGGRELTLAIASD